MNRCGTTPRRSVGTPDHVGQNKYHGKSNGETVMRRKGLYRSVAFLAIAGLIAGACGDDDSAPPTPSEEAEAPLTNQLRNLLLKPEM